MVTDPHQRLMPHEAKSEAGAHGFAPMRMACNIVFREALTFLTLV